MAVARPKLWLIFTLAVAVATSLLLFYYLKGVEQAAVEQVMTTVVVADKKIPQGTRLTAEMVKTVTMPVKYTHPQAAAEVDKVVKQYTTVDLVPEEVVLTSQLASEQTSSELPYKIPAGTRAITIAVNPLTGVAGHIKPGHYVDVLMTYKDTQGDKEELEDTKVLTLLQKILVLAVGPDLSKKEGVQETENITLAVPPGDAQLVMLSENIGRMKLVLRPADADEQPSLRTIDVRNIRNR